jgi:hypothetical protein
VDLQKAYWIHTLKKIEIIASVYVCFYMNMAHRFQAEGEIQLQYSLLKSIFWLSTPLWIPPWTLHPLPLLTSPFQTLYHPNILQQMFQDIWNMSLNIGNNLQALHLIYLLIVLVYQAKC